MYSCSRYVTPVARMAVSRLLLSVVLHLCKMSPAFVIRCGHAPVDIGIGRWSAARVAQKPYVCE